MNSPNAMTTTFFSVTPTMVYALPAHNRTRHTTTTFLSPIELPTFKTNPSHHLRRKLAPCKLSSISLPKPQESITKTLKDHFFKTPNPESMNPSSSFIVYLFSNGNNDGNDGNGNGDSNSNNGNGDGFWRKVLFFFLIGSSKRSKAIAKEGATGEWDPHGLSANCPILLNSLSRFKKYKVSEIEFFDQLQRTKIGAEDEICRAVALFPGRVYTKADILKELERLSKSGVFEKIDFEAKTKADGTIGLKILFKEAVLPSYDKFRCISVGLLPPWKPTEMDPDMTRREKKEYYRDQEKDYMRRIADAKPCLLPMPVQAEVLEMLRGHGKVTSRLRIKIRDKIHKWYYDEGYVAARVLNFRNLNEELTCEVGEGDITRVDVQFYDKLGNKCEGNTQMAVITRELPKQLGKGHVLNIEAEKLAWRNIISHGLFSKVEIQHRLDQETVRGAIVEIRLNERDQKKAEVITTWSIVPGRHGQPSLASIQPGGTVVLRHRNLKGLNRSFVGSITTGNFLNPKDDLSFELEYVHPYFDGVHNPSNRTFHANCFNSRKLSPVFTNGPAIDEVPPIWVDRAGVKAYISENYSRQSKFSYGLVMERITTRDHNKNITRNGRRQSATGDLSAFGPPTTLSGTGVDQMVFAQANLTRDNTKSVNGTLVGERNVFQLDQGLFIGSNFPFFNRCQFTYTRFVQLKEVEEGAGKPPPPVLVLHGHYGGCVGDLPSYDAFTLGGPYSVRGYNMGELGACRNLLELAAELRIPVRNTHVYAFVEHGNDLGSSKDVLGNPTEFYRRVGHGSSYGVGVKLGQVRAEYVVDHNSSRGSVFVRYGERF